MSSIENLHIQHITKRIYDKIQEYGRDMNIYQEKPLYPEKQISDTIDYLRGEGCIKDIDVKCKNGNITNDGILNVNLEITLKPETIIKDFK